MQGNKHEQNVIYSKMTLLSNLHEQTIIWKYLFAAGQVQASKVIKRNKR